MKPIQYLILLIASAGFAWAQRSTNPYTTPQSEAPNVSSPVQNPTRVPLQGAYERPPIRINSANDIVTGNVAGGREFRGPVPYNVPSQLGVGLSDPGSSSVSSFLRRSAGSPYVAPYGDSTQRYYDPMRATTSFQPSGQSGYSRPMISTPTSIARISVPQLTDLERLARPQRPAWQETTELESLIMQQMGLRQLAMMEEQISKLDPAQLERLNPRLRQLLEPSNELADPAKEKKELLFDESLSPVLPDKPAEPVKLTETERLRIQREQLEQMRKELETLLEPESAASAQPKTDPSAKLKTDIPEKPKSKSESLSQTQSQTASSTNLKSKLPPLPRIQEDQTQTPSVESEKPVEPTEKPFRLPSPEQRTRIRQLLGPYKNFEVLTADKTTDFLQQGDQFMIKRQYYRAAEAYTLAAVWQYDNPQIYLKQSIALFGAGAYMSSAEALQRALLLKPELAGEKIDILSCLGGNVSGTGTGTDTGALARKENQDLYDARMREIGLKTDKNFLKQSDSGILALLVSYLYYQEGDIGLAKKGIEISAQLYSDDPAVVAMQKVLSPDAVPSKATP